MTGNGDRIEGRINRMKRVVRLGQRSTMKQTNKRKREMSLRVAGSVFLCVALFFSALILGRAGAEDMKVDSVGTPFGVAMLAMCAYDLLSFVYKRESEKKLAFFRIGYAVLDLVAAVFAFCSGISVVYLLTGGVVYLAIPILKRVASVLRNHKKRNVVLNILMFIFAILLFLFEVAFFGVQEYSVLVSAGLVGGVMCVSCLINVGMMALSNFKVELLRKIVRKTYAGEIMFGLLLLIVSFSLAFMSLEPNIKSFGDAIWYSFAVVTTIGFGDFVASSTLGRIMTVVLGTYGIVVVSIITSIIVNFYNEVKSTDDDEEPEESQKELEESQKEPSESSKEPSKEPAAEEKTEE